MRVLLDECVPHKLKYELPGHDVRTVGDMGWSGFKNGPLLIQAALEFDTFITIDQGSKHKQTLSSPTMAIIILATASHNLDALRPLIPQLLLEIQGTHPGNTIRVPP